ncbi:hypothetical protein GTGU_01130 [Trabulsiella guamensis ATCC 49490]|uniref:Lipoprotein n=1 Tax=Trabulsiella guamensis ATCC 49490 TaxID=1005994 RepID=A0A085AG46_9ENTR|nr:DUF2931 family protein [Trabulsiella guamensis]KFC09191.1 hypothetical protein GTGU_01130 [Trabulsiella guamensis ATCC 49490]
MKKNMFAIFILFTVMTGCHYPASHPLQSRQAAEGDWTLPYKEWRFDFFTPFALYATVTYVQIIDVEGYLNQFFTLDSAEDDPNVQGTWSQTTGSTYLSFNKVKSLPQYMLFCWDSIIDKKTYETSILFSPKTWQRMKTPADHTSYSGRTVWYDTLLIGLAPEGKVRLWLDDVNRYPNIPVTPAQMITRSGKEMKFCQGITEHPNGYVYFGDTPGFIKGKTYPYGSW